MFPAMRIPILVITLACLSSAKPAAFNNFGSGGISFGNFGGSSIGNLGGSSFGSSSGSYEQAVQREAQNHFNNFDWDKLSRGSINVDSTFGRSINQDAQDILNRQRANMDWSRPIQVDSTGFHQDAQNTLNRVGNNLNWNRPITVDSTGINDWVRSHNGGSQGNSGSSYLDSGNSGSSYSDSGNSGSSYSDSGNSGSSYLDSGNSGSSYADSGNSGNSYSDSGNSGSSYMDSGNSGTSYSDSGNSGTSYSDSGNSGTSYSDSGNSGTSYSDSGNSRTSYSDSVNDNSRSEFDMGTGEYGSGEYGIGWCPDFTPGDNAGYAEWFLQEHQMIEPTCEQSCKANYPHSIGITESTVETYSDGSRFKCWCEFGEPRLNESGGYRTCLFG